MLNAVLKLHTIFLVSPEPVEDDCTNNRWKFFKGCLGALDGTYIPVKVRNPDKPRYRNRKGNVTVNVLAACDRNMNYTYVLTGWEGSATDSRVLRDAIAHPNGLKFSNGNYYLCDGGYTNVNGFLAPYIGVRYHVREWDDAPTGPQNYQEFFNLKHAKARNVIEQSFGVLKARWGILRSSSWYPIKIQNRIILASCLLHNFIRMNMSVDPMADVLEFYSESNPDDVVGNDDFIEQFETSQVWTSWRENLAISMYNEYIGGY